VSTSPAWLQQFLLSARNNGDEQENRDTKQSNLYRMPIPKHVLCSAWSRILMATAAEAIRWSSKQEAVAWMSLQKRSHQQKQTGSGFQQQIPKLCYIGTNFTVKTGKFRSVNRYLHRILHKILCCNITIVVFWVLTPCSLVGGYKTTGRHNPEHYIVTRILYRPREH
jgi:hypothetical protein